MLCSILYQKELKEIYGRKRNESGTLEPEVRVTISFLKGFKYFINSAIVSVQRMFFAFHFETYGGEVLYTFFPATVHSIDRISQEKTYWNKRYATNQQQSRSSEMCILITKHCIHKFTSNSRSFYTVLDSNPIYTR